MLNQIEEIKNRLDIVEVVGSYIKLHKAGANFRAVCPFHSEKKPSFFVSPARQIWHCFGCQKGGDAFGFVKEIEGIEFGDALRLLAQRAGVELKRYTPEYAKLQTEREKLYEICDLATRFFEKQLKESKVGTEAKKYLLARGISEESITKWRLGYAPDTWQGLSDFLNSRGYQKEEVEKAGLGLESKEGSFYDRFRGRIIFPIFDLNSQVIGFGGRVFKEKDKQEIAKYVNTPSTLLYDKSRILYGLDKAKLKIRKRDSCILVEGYTDVILAHQVGTENVVATSGTALTIPQLKILKRYSNNLILGFDMDIAGETAAKRGIDLAQIQGFDIKVIQLPEGKKDAADVISANPQEWEKTIQKLKSIMEFYFETAFSKANPKTPEGKKEISKILLPIIKKIPNQIEKSYWIQKLARDLEIREEDIRQELKKVKLEPLTTFQEEEFGQIESIKSGGGHKPRKELLEERLIIMILKSPENLNLVSEDKLNYFSLQSQEVLIKLKNKQTLSSEFFNYLSLKAELEEIEEKDILPEIQFCLKEIQSIEIKNRLDQISRDLKRAEGEKDVRKTNDLTQRFSDTASELTNL